jgi:hypothetical protein
LTRGLRPRSDAADPTAGYSVGAPFWQPLPGTQAGGAWLAHVTGPSGHAVAAPVAPAVPRVRKGLPPGAPLLLSPAEARDVILEYKCAPPVRRPLPRGDLHALRDAAQPVQRSAFSCAGRAGVCWRCG